MIVVLSFNDIDHDINNLYPNSNSLVRKIILWRHNFIAHRGFGASINSNNILSSNSISEEELRAAIDHSIFILNKYSRLYRNSTFIPDMPNMDDYRSLLRNIGFSSKGNESEGV